MLNRILVELDGIFKTYNKTVADEENMDTRVLFLLGSLKKIQGLIQGYQAGEDVNKKENL